MKLRTMGSDCYFLQTDNPVDYGKKERQKHDKNLVGGGYVAVG